MKIMLIRHGEPERLPRMRISSSEFSQWIVQYNEAGILEDSKPAQNTLVLAKASNLIVSSTLHRSIHSARLLHAELSNAGLRNTKLLKTEPNLISEPLYAEAGMPFLNGTRVRLTPNAWLILYRVSWFLGFSNNSESATAAKQRAFTAATKLEDLATAQDTVTLVGHGIFNKFIAKVLTQRGWKGPISPASKYWSISVYTKQ